MKNRRGIFGRFRSRHARKAMARHHPGFPPASSPSKQAHRRYRGTAATAAWEYSIAPPAVLHFPGSRGSGPNFPPAGYLPRLHGGGPDRGAGGLSCSGSHPSGFGRAFQLPSRIFLIGSDHFPIASCADHSESGAGAFPSAFLSRACHSGGAGGGSASASVFERRASATSLGRAVKKCSPVCFSIFATEVRY